MRRIMNMSINVRQQIYKRTNQRELNRPEKNHLQPVPTAGSIELHVHQTNYARNANVPCHWCIDGFILCILNSGPWIIYCIAVIQCFRSQAIVQWSNPDYFSADANYVRNRSMILKNKKHFIWKYSDSCGEKCLLLP